MIEAPPLAPRHDARDDLAQAREGIAAYEAAVGPDGDPLDVEALPYAMAARTIRNGDEARPREWVPSGCGGAVRLGLVSWGFPAWGPGRRELTYGGNEAHLALLADYVGAARYRIGPGPSHVESLLGVADPTADPAIPDGTVDDDSEVELTAQTLGARASAGLADLARIAIAGPEREMDSNDWAEPAYVGTAEGRHAVPTSPTARAVHLVAAMAADIGAGADG